MVEVYTQELAFGLYKSGMGTEGSNSRRLLWISSYAEYALALDFFKGAYWAGGTQAASLSAMSGYSYTRTGQVSYLNAAPTIISDFAANAPPILPNIGYESYEALTNLCLQSQTFDNASWTKDGTTATANQIIAPDAATLTADLITETATNAEHRILQVIASNTGVTKSVFAKAGTAGFIGLSDGLATAYAIFDLTLGVVSSQNGAVGTITSCGNGWYRCAITTSIANQTSVTINMGDTAAHAIPGTVYLGTGRTLYLWQAQYFVGTYSDGGPIILTTGATAGFGAAEFSINDAPTDVTQLFWAIVNQPFQTASSQRLAGWDNASDAEIIYFNFAGGNASCTVNVASSVVYVAALANAVGTYAVVLLRSAGTWRAGVIRSGVLTWMGGASAAAFPAVTKVYPGQYRGAIQHTEGAVKGVFRKTLTITSDASILSTVGSF